MRVILPERCVLYAPLIELNVVHSGGPIGMQALPKTV